MVEEVVNGVVTRQYTYGLQRINEAQSINGTWTQSFYGYDGGGSVRQLTNASAAITDTYNYDAFGNLLNSTGTTPNNYLYRGEQFDTDLGLYYLRARYYNPQTGRFLSRDPEDGKIKIPASLHKYLYASGDPVNRFDPTGRTDLMEVDLENATVKFSSHGLDHLVEEGAPETQAEAEALIEALVREWIAEFQVVGVNLPNPFDLIWTSPLLQNVPWIIRVFIVSAVDLRISTYAPMIL